jgi:antibiotic biosynthesis monooxygenase (ABM) superfamily enzyme
MIYRSILRFHVRAGMADEFQAAYDAGEFLTRAADVPGFIRADLLRQDSDDHEYVAMAEWENKEAYLEWQDRIPKLVPGDVLARVGAVLAPPEPGNVYAVLQSVSAS